MLRKHAFQFFVLSLSLERLHQRLGMPLPSALTPTGFGAFGNLGAGILSPPIAEGIAATRANPLQVFASPPPPTVMEIYLTDDEQRDCKRYLAFVDGSLREIDIFSVSPEIDRVKNGLAFCPREKARWQVGNITDRVLDEIKDQSFLHVKNPKIDFYEQPELFDSEIGKKFGKINNEITNAGTCFALEQYTATVFHLMRVMEHCLQQLGTKLKVSLDVKNESWAKIMDQVNKEIEKLPGGSKSVGVKATRAQKVRLKKMALAASRLDHVRIAWRNDVMHPKAKYDEKEATEVLVSVRAFLESIVKLV